ncbi:lycopene cyclase family protein [Actinokineospora pegani]|uniref:lycopene cyclase family protein n=1 Tax=Actinokineospora pegani TaxID=2654637 RepID=UPI0018D2DAE2|nr:lycopene cyclase family protein [Actinokineospora pegani]
MVVGAGPAGWSVAAACAARGLEAALVSPGPRDVWPATYGMWAGQEPAGVEAVRSDDVWASGRRLGRGYVVLDNASALAGFDRDGVVAVDDAVVGVRRGQRGATVVLGSGRRLACRDVVDASGVRRVVSGGPVRGRRAEQTAFGLVLRAEDVPEPGRVVFMDGWCVDGGVASFLYTVPLPGGRVLVEETSLVARPGVSVELLRQRLLRRLGDVAARAVGVERVRFPMDLPPAAGVGVAGGLMHPATGYSVADSFAVAPVVAAAVAAGEPVGRAVWTVRARAVRELRAHGARLLRRLPAEGLPEFFDAFFALPEDLRQAYLTGREDVAGTAAAMTEVFRGVPWRLRGDLVSAGALSGGIRAAAGIRRRGRRAGSGR